ncbi:MAG: AAA family ATPase [bacterium]
MKTKIATFSMGLPAAGKSTWLAQNMGDIFTIDPDAVKESHPDYDPKNPAALHAWSKDITRNMFSVALNGNRDFILDGTGTHAESMVHKMRQARKAGFQVNLVFVTVAMETSLKRNAARARTVPEYVVMEKAQLIQTAFDIVSQEADEVLVVKND